MGGREKRRREEKRREGSFLVLGIACVIWVITPLIGFFNLTRKQITISVPILILLGEVLFLIAIAFLGKEYWIKIKVKGLSPYLDTSP